jgi:hypothetical protein
MLAGLAGLADHHMNCPFVGRREVVFRSSVVCRSLACGACGIASPAPCSQIPFSAAGPTSRESQAGRAASRLPQAPFR